MDWMRAFLIFFFIVFSDGFAEKAVTSKKEVQQRQSTLVKVLTIENANKMKKRQCVLFHFWATWCTKCLTELPGFLEWAKANKQIEIAVIDTSAPFVQKNFSRRWIASELNPGFTVYVRPKGKEEKYISGIEKDWTGELPLTVLYQQGKRLSRWVGVFDEKRFVEIEKLVNSKCQSG